MKRTIRFSLLVVIIVTLLLTSCSMENLPQGELINEVRSPSGEKVLKVYLVDGGATVDYAIRCEVCADDGLKRTIYWNYHEEDAIVEWITDDTVSINGHRINVLTGKYDWRME